MDFRTLAVSSFFSLLREPLHASGLPLFLFILNFLISSFAPTLSFFFLFREHFLFYYFFVAADFSFFFIWNNRRARRWTHHSFRRFFCPIKRQKKEKQKKGFYCLFPFPSLFFLSKISTTEKGRRPKRHHDTHGHYATKKIPMIIVEEEQKKNIRV